MNWPGGAPGCPPGSVPRPRLPPPVRLCCPGPWAWASGTRLWCSSRLSAEDRDALPASWAPKGAPWTEAPSSSSGASDWPAPCPAQPPQSSLYYRKPFCLHLPPLLLSGRQVGGRRQSCKAYSPPGSEDVTETDSSAQLAASQNRNMPRLAAEKGFSHKAAK